MGLFERALARPAPKPRPRRGGRVVARAVQRAATQPRVASQRRVVRPAGRSVGAAVQTTARREQRRAVVRRQAAAKARGKATFGPVQDPLSILKEAGRRAHREEVRIVRRSPGFPRAPIVPSGGGKRAPAAARKLRAGVSARRQAMIRGADRSARATGHVSGNAARDRFDDAVDAVRHLAKEYDRTAGVGAVRRYLAGNAREQQYNLGPGGGTAVDAALGEAAKHPGRTVAKSFDSAVESIKGLPQGVERMVEDPVGSVKAIAKDYARRYGSVDGAREAVKQQGLTPYALDALGVAGGAGAVLGKVSKVTRAGRPALQVSGRAVRQATSHNYFGARAQHALDRARGRVQAKRVREVQAGKRQRLDPVVQQAAAHGTVAPLRSSLRVAPFRRFNTRAVRQVAGTLGRAHLEHQHLRSHVDREARKVSKDPHGALKHMVQLGLRDPRPGLVRKRLRMIEGGRTHRAVEEVVGETKAAAPARLRGRGRLLQAKFSPERRRQVRERHGLPPGEAEVSGPAEVAAYAARHQGSSRRVPNVRQVLEHALRPEAERRARRAWEALDPGERGALKPMIADELEVLVAKASAEVQRRKIPGSGFADETPTLRALLDDPRMVGEARLVRRQVKRAAARHPEVDVGRAGTRVERERRVLVEKAEAAEKRAAKLKNDPGALREAKRARRRADLAPRVGDRALERTYGPQAEFLGVRRRHDEPVRGWVHRVRAAAKREGLDDPGFWKSTTDEKAAASEFTKGTLTDTVARSKRYTGSLFERGLEAEGPDVHRRAMLDSVRKSVNYTLVNRLRDEHAFPWSHGEDGKGLTRAQVWQLLRGEDRGGAAQRHRVFDDKGRMVAVDPNDVIVVRASTHIEPRDVVPGEKVAHPDDLGEGRFYVLPRDAGEELRKQAAPSGGGLRVVQGAKGLASMTILGTNPAWLVAQVAANALMSAAVVRHPSSAYRWWAWWKRLDPDQKARMASYIGIGPADFEMRLPHGGAAVDDTLSAWDAFWRNPMVKKAGWVVPVKWVLMGDHVNNRQFRSMLFHDKAKREAFNRMVADQTAYSRGMKRLVPKLFRRPGTRREREQFMNTWLREQDNIETVARHVDKFLGDYATFTSTERRVLNSVVMFYPFLRFSIRFVFKTMPVEHPVITSILGTIGRMGAEWQKEILGGDDMLLGKVFIGDKAINVANLNPGLNAVTSLNKPTQLVSSVNPILSIPVGVLTGTDMFRGKYQPWGGKAGVKEPGDLGVGELARAGARQVLMMAAPYRALGKAGVGFDESGPQSADSLFGDRPVKFKDKEIQANVADRARKNREAGVLGATFGFLPRGVSEDRDVQKSLNEAGKKKVKKPRRKKPAGYLPSVSGSGGSYLPKVGGGSSGYLPKLP